MTFSAKIASTTAALALFAAQAAWALPVQAAGHGHAGEHGASQGVMYVFKGSYVDTATVDVATGNHHVVAAGLTGPVSFDFTSAKVVVGDVNGDGARNLDDVAAGDRVVVKVKAPRTDPGDEPYAAKQLVDQTHPADADAD
jgi:hypothetical protein